LAAYATKAAGCSGASMDVTWEKLILWIIAAIVVIIIITFMVVNLRPEGSGAVGTLFKGIDSGALGS